MPKLLTFFSFPSPFQLLMLHEFREDNATWDTLLDSEVGSIVADAFTVELAKALLEERYVRFFNFGSFVKLVGLCNSFPSEFEFFLCQNE